MTSMPDLHTPGYGVSLPPVAGASAARTASPPEPAPPRLSGEETATARADARRVSAERREIDARLMAAEVVRDALTETRRQVAPALADLQRVFDRPAVSRDQGTEAVESEEERLAAAKQLAARMRLAAARLTAVRLQVQERATVTAGEIREDAERLAEINRELRASEPPSDARRAELRDRQRQVVDRLVEATGAAVRENRDGTVDLTLGDRALVAGDRVAPIRVGPGPTPAPESAAPRPGAENPSGVVATPGNETRSAGDARPGTGPAAPTTPSPGLSSPESSVPGTGTQPDAVEVARPGPGTAGPSSPATPSSGRSDGAAVDPGRNPASGSAPALQATWADGAPVALGGRLGGLVSADRTVALPAVAGLDAVARGMAETLTGAPEDGTSPAAPGVPLLVGETAWDLHVPAGAGAQAMTAAALRGDTGVVADGLRRLEASSSGEVAALERRAGLVDALDGALGLVSSRVGQNLSTALGAIDGVSSAGLVTALHRANAAMAGVGAAAKAALPAGIPVLVGSSDPSVVTAAGILPADAPAAGMLRVSVLALAGEETPPAEPIADAEVDAATGEDAPAPVIIPPAVIPPGEMPVQTWVTGAGQSTAPDGTAGTGEVSDAPDDVTGVDGGVGEVGTDPQLTEAGGIGTGVGGPESSTSADGVAPAGTGGGAAPTDRTRVDVDGQEFSSATNVVSVRPGLDVTVHGPGSAVLAVTPDPGPALDRVQGLVDAVGAMTDAVRPEKSAVILDAEAKSEASAVSGGSALATARSAATSLWSSLSGASDSGESPVAGAVSEVDQVLAAVAAPLSAAVGAAFLHESAGGALIPGTALHRGRVSLDRERFAHEYVRDAAGVEAAVAAVARAVAGTADSASDPRIGVLPVKIQAELDPHRDYTVGHASTNQHLEARHNELDRKADALAALLQHLHDESTWLGEQLR